METYNKNTDVAGRPGGSPADSGRNGRIMGGMFVVAIGVLLLARQAGLDVPRWIFSFETILIAVGVYVGIRHSFRGFFWVIPIAIGGFLLLDDFYPEYDISNFTWPLIIIGVGLAIMLRSGRKNDPGRPDTRCGGEVESSEDVLDSTVIFGGSKKNIISKSFKGGEVVTVFGGTEVNLMQSDINGTVVLEVTQVFGGTKLIVPAHWKIWSKEIVAILGGVDDKRPVMNSSTAAESDKTLVLKGTCVLGGLEIRSY